MNIQHLKELLLDVREFWCSGLVRVYLQVRFRNNAPGNWASGHRFTVREGNGAAGRTRWSGWVAPGRLRVQPESHSRGTPFPDRGCNPRRGLSDCWVEGRSPAASSRGDLHTLPPLEPSSLINSTIFEHSHSMPWKSNFLQAISFKKKKNLNLLSP